MNYIKKKNNKKCIVRNKTKAHTKTKENKK